METTAIQDLERAALAAHRLGVDWATFWADHAEQARQAEPYNCRRFHRLMRQLLTLLVSGDMDGHQPVGNDLEPWGHDDADDQTKPKRHQDGRVDRLGGRRGTPPFWLLLGNLGEERDRGTAPLLGTVCFACPTFSNAIADRD